MQELVEFVTGYLKQPRRAARKLYRAIVTAGDMRRITDHEG
jgi:hypothetical protein